MADEHVSADIRVRSGLMDEVVAYAKGKRWTEAEAAQHFGVTQPRWGEVLRGEYRRFILEDLIRMLVRAGLRVQLTLRSQPR